MDGEEVTDVDGRIVEVVELFLLEPHPAKTRMASSGANHRRYGVREELRWRPIMAPQRRRTRVPGRPHAPGVPRCMLPLIQCGCGELRGWELVSQNLTNQTATVTVASDDSSTEATVTFQNSTPPT